MSVKYQRNPSQLSRSVSYLLEQSFFYSTNPNEHLSSNCRATVEQVCRATVEQPSSKFFLFAQCPPSVCRAQFIVLGKCSGCAQRAKKNCSTVARRLLDGCSTDARRTCLTAARPLLDKCSLGLVSGNITINIVYKS